jgi:eukaryotic-like serine/threonine-protein kinase
MCTRVMALAPGEHVGPFEILSSLGAGGMGEMYRGRDPQLRRDVAIKVLPEAMRHDAMRLARFEREARVLAALSHPNIAAIHGLEQHDGINALVLELVEGETLAARIACEPNRLT